VGSAVKDKTSDVLALMRTIAHTASAILSKMVPCTMNVATQRRLQGFLGPVEFDCQTWSHLIGRPSVLFLLDCFSQNLHPVVEVAATLFSWALIPFSLRFSSSSRANASVAQADRGRHVVPE